MDILTYGLLNKKVEEAKNVSGEKITEAVNAYLGDNPPTTGATAEQAAQIDKNVADIGELKSDLGELASETESKLESLEDYLFTLNLFDYYAEDNVSGYIANNGGISTNTNYMTTGFIKVKPNTRYYVAGGYKSEFGIRTVPFLLEYTEDKTPSTYHTDVPYYFTTNSTTKYIRFTYRAVQDKYRVGLSEFEIPVSGLPLNDKKVNVRKSDVPQNQIRRITTKADSLTANSYLADTGMAFAPRKNSRIAFSGSFSSFSKLTIGLEKFGGDRYNRIQITPTEITAYNYNGTTTTYEHGLTLENNIQVLLEIGFAFNCNLTLVSNGVAFTQTNIRWDGKYNTFVFAMPSMDMTDCVLSWTSKDLNKSIWMFGDSYFGYTDHWAFYLNKSG